MKRRRRGFINNSWCSRWRMSTTRKALKRYKSIKKIYTGTKYSGRTPRSSVHIIECMFRISWLKVESLKKKISIKYRTCGKPRVKLKMKFRRRRLRNLHKVLVKRWTRLRTFSKMLWKTLMNSEPKAKLSSKLYNRKLSHSKTRRKNLRYKYSIYKTKNSANESESKNLETIKL